MTCYNTDERLEEYGFDIRVLIQVDYKFNRAAQL